VADLAAPELDAADRHHLERVLRLRPGDELTVADGAGGWRPCRFGPVLEATGDVRHDPEPSPSLTVAFAVVKGDRPEWAVQKLTELGVDRIVPLVAARSVVRWDGHAAGKHVERWRRVAREASVQSRRTRLPVVEQPAGFDQVAERPCAALADPDGEPPWLATTVLVGPEGGWDHAELDAPLPRLALGPEVLRTETAAVAAGALLCALRAGLVAPTTHR
jgi:16S rRNA (uracil1498-N3)-methyltransferase